MLPSIIDQTTKKLLETVALAGILVGCSSSKDPNVGAGGTSAETGGTTGTSGASSTGGSYGYGGSGGNSSSGGTTGAGGSGGSTVDGSTGGSVASGGSSNTGGGSSTGGNYGFDGGCPGLGPLLPPLVFPTLLVPPTTTLEQRFYAVGYQVYTCEATTVPDASVTSYAWAFKGPEALLLDDSCTAVGTHFAGPTWKSDADGSYATGTSVVAYRPILPDGGPDTNNIPWLRLTSVGSGSGIFSNITYVQRLDTWGGVMPDASTCGAGNAGQDQAVAYRAVYYFYSGG